MKQDVESVLLNNLNEKFDPTYYNLIKKRPAIGMETAVYFFWYPYLFGVYHIRDLFNDGSTRR
jgi:hypothetical protein